MGQAQGYCCNDKNMQDKRRGEVRLYTKDDYTDRLREADSSDNGTPDLNEDAAEARLSPNALQVSDTTPTDH